MRVANIIEEARVGGPQVRMVRVAAALKGQAETVIFMPTDHAGPFQELCDQHGVDYRAMPITKITKKLGPALRYLLFSPFEVVMLARAFAREDVDVVHVSGGSWQYKGVLAARLSGKPVLWHLNDTCMPRFIRRIFRPMSRLATGFIFASHRSQKYYGGIYRAGLVEGIVPSVVDPDQFDPDLAPPPSTDDTRCLEAWGNELVVGTVANVNPVKGLETLIRAAAELENAGVQARIAIVGQIGGSQDRYYARLLSLIQELGVTSVEFCGPRADVRPLVRRFAVYVCSSNAESSPVSVWEAMTLALPVVSTDVGDVARYVRSGETGEVVAVGDHEALAEKIALLLQSADDRSALGAHARSVATKTFSPRRIAELTLLLYQSAINKQRT